MSARDVEKDHYAALGVPKDASAADIKKAYRKLARDLHPDTNPAGEERFKVVSEAYDVLSDPARRKDYDENRRLFGAGLRPPGSTGSPGGPTGGTFDLGDLFARAGGGGGGGGGGSGFGDVLGGLFGRGSGAPPRIPKRGLDMEAQTSLSFPDAVNGATVSLQITKPAACNTCRGSGAAPGTTPQTCGTCQGKGVTSRSQGGFAFSEPCPTCKGSGRVIPTPCPTCHGTGSTTATRTLQVRIPVGVADGQRIRIAGRGGPGERGGPSGDLFVVVHVAPHPYLRRRDDNLLVTVPVTFPEAALGGQISVPTMDTPVTLKIPAGTASGRTFRVRGRGVPGKGDLLVKVEVAVPQKLSGKAKKALESYASSSDDDPRAPLRAAAGMDTA